jgi:hypothetical protein
VVTEAQVTIVGPKIEVPESHQFADTSGKPYSNKIAKVVERAPWQTFTWMRKGRGAFEVLWGRSGETEWMHTKTHLASPELPSCSRKGNCETLKDGRFICMVSTTM